jgi:hypothetical protein
MLFFIVFLFKNILKLFFYINISEIKKKLKKIILKYKNKRHLNLTDIHGVLLVGKNKKLLILSIHVSGTVGRILLDLTAQIRLTNVRAWHGT